MTSQLKWKFIIIVTVVLVCVYGMFGRPDAPPPGPRSTEFRRQH